MLFLISFSNKSMWSELSLRHGTKSKFFPPLFRKLSFPWILISSKVSTQSEAKPGQITNIFLIPLSNPLECFSILKSHADMLTILFIIGVIAASANSLDRTTTGIMSMMLVIIITIKGFKGMFNSI